MPNRRNEARDAAIAAGLTTFIGKPCKHGHFGERFVHDYKCKQCCYDNHAHRRNSAEFRNQASQRHKTWRASNHGRALEYSRIWYEENKDRALASGKEWARNNRERRRAIMRRYYSNSPKPLAYAKARQKRVRRATPQWADMPAIRAFYEQCPPDMQVDHVIPIHGATVCGLHVLENLQYLSSTENSSKSNRWSEWSSDGSDDSSLFSCEPFHYKSEVKPKE
jgi:hypothetical protein